MSLTFHEIRQTPAYLAVRLNKIFFSRLSVLLYLFLIAPLLANEAFKQDSKPLALAGVLILGWLWILHRFIEDKLSVPPKENQNLSFARRLSYHMVQHLSAKTEISPIALLEAAMESDRGLFVLHQIDLGQEAILEALQVSPLDCSLETALGWIQEAVNGLQTERTDSTATIYAFLIHVPALQALVYKTDLSLDDLKDVLRAEAFHFYLQERKRDRLNPERIVKTMGSIGRSWVLGYNTALERLTNNISGTVLSHERSIMIHRDSLKTMEEIFTGQNTVSFGHESGRGANLLLLGNTGTGKRTLIRNLAYILRREEISRGEPFTNVLLLKTALLLSGSAQSDRDFLKAVDDTSEGGRFILVIEDTSMFLKAADPRLKEILLNLLQSKNVRVAAVANIADYHTLIKTDPLIDNLFKIIYLEDSTDRESMAVLLEEYFGMEGKRRLRMSYRALKILLDLCKQFIGRGGLPGKAVDVLRETVVRLRGSGRNTVTEDDVRETISERTRMDVRTLTGRGKDMLLSLEERLQEHIVGQRQAISSLVAALKRGRLNLQVRKRPIGTFLFLGQTGVGKTETAKALATEYFGSATSLASDGGSPASFIRVDMNELSDESGIHSLIGGQGTSGFTEGFLTKRVLDRPFSLVLFDEIEKAHPKVLNVLLQMLDEGTLIDGQGVKTDFKNTIIIATSNAGVHWLKDHVMPQKPDDRDGYRGALLDAIIAEHVFSPEFVNRFDEVILFSPPTPDEVRRLAILMLDGIIKDVRSQKGIEITVDTDIIDLLAVRGFNPDYGAREMRRIITQTIENYLADYLLSHTVKRGDRIEIKSSDLKN
ncbi:hypothetical protein A3A67_03885 [Candidatus Peribacteria bacterium RIFCSPLOWO2_01_FULL_51_18]|nr:MAG: hypothetical protein A3A67_03885 [Candidatus Peribacteria bacterium RIFCSPLOWO2_01_FULL_51_18]OGJ67217.1 MAG: hypothetical protein A3J34_02355 [Candidatus Peribacteria bacterium RIFCSPLOWO2_02_FULL_51_10]